MTKKSLDGMFCYFRNIKHDTQTVLRGKTKLNVTHKTIQNSYHTHFNY